jgi:Ca-activated chloride channel family protein
MNDIQIDKEREYIPSNSKIGLKVRVQIIPEGLEGSKSITHSSSTIILLDNSGSMSGNKLEDAKNAVLEYIKSLNPNDFISLYTFSDVTEKVIDNANLSDNIENFKTKILGIGVGGSTNMWSALNETLKLVRINEGRARDKSVKILLVTDGFPTDGGFLPDGNVQLFTKISTEFLKLGIPLYLIGIGSDYNEDLLLKMYRANEIGFFRHVDENSSLQNLFDEISKEKILYPSRNLIIKLTPGTSVKKIYKLEPQILELNPEKSDDHTLMVPLGNIGTEKQKVLMLIELPSRPSGEYREGLFSIELDQLITKPLTVTRTEDLDKIKNSKNEIISAEYMEAETNVLSQVALDKNDQKSSQEATIELRKKLETIKKNPSMTKILGEDKIRDIEETQKIIQGTIKVSPDDLKKKKEGFTRRRGTGGNNP